MMNRIKNISTYLFLLMALCFFTACEEEDQLMLNPSASLTLTSSANELVLDKKDEGKQVLSLTWDKPNYGFNAAPEYQVWLDKKGNNFASAKVISVGGELKKSFTNEELNSILQNLEFTPGESEDLEVKVVALLGQSYSIVSEVKTIPATAFASVLDLSTTWGVVGSATPNGWDGPDLPFYTTKENGVIVAYVTLAEGEIKFRENNEWTNNLGDDGADGSLEPGGANIAVTPGSYRILLNLNNNTYQIDSYSWGLVGSAYNDWGATPDANFEYDPFTDQWRLLVTLKEGEFKIRANNDWGTNYGDDGADGSLEDGGANIVSAAGNYLITFNLNELTYSVEPINIWGLVGSAYNDWGATPDASFSRDWSGDDLWILRNVTLLDGEFKIRANNDWAVNYGDSDSDGVLDTNDNNNIAIEAGTYTVRLDFSNPDAPTYTVE